MFKNEKLLKDYIENMHKFGYAVYDFDNRWSDSLQHIINNYFLMNSNLKNLVYFSMLNIKDFKKISKNEIPLLYHGGYFNLKTKKIEMRFANEFLDTNFFIKKLASPEKITKEDFIGLKFYYHKADYINIGFPNIEIKQYYDLTKIQPANNEKKTPFINSFDYGGFHRKNSENDIDGKFCKNVIDSYIESFNIIESNRSIIYSEIKKDIIDTKKNCIKEVKNSISLGYNNQILLYNRNYLN